MKRFKLALAMLLLATMTTFGQQPFTATQADVLNIGFSAGMPAGMTPTTVLSSPKADLTQFKYSLAAVAVSSILDVHSSIGLREINPILGRGNFGLEQVRNKSISVGAMVGIEFLVVKKWPSTARAFKWFNITYSGVTTGVAIHNYGLDRSSTAVVTVPLPSVRRR